MGVHCMLLYLAPKDLLFVVVLIYTLMSLRVKSRCACDGVLHFLRTRSEGTTSCIVV